jgi:polar amino acid transport system substrate-binding protein
VTTVRQLGRILTLLLALMAAGQPVQSGELVRVGGYPFLPFVDPSGGLTSDLLVAMNAIQKDYTFQLVNTSSKRRYRDMADGSFSMVLFENIKWGWDPSQVQASKVFLQGDGEVYVALSQQGRGQEYFKTLQGKHILGVSGYHYGFANFTADPERLAQQFNISFSPDNAVSLRNLLAGRGDVAVITKSYLKSYLLKDPQAASRLLVSERFDQTYAHSAVVKRGSKPSPQELDAIFDRMESAGVLKQLWAKYGLDN